MEEAVKRREGELDGERVNEHRKKESVQRREHKIRHSEKKMGEEK